MLTKLLLALTDPQVDLLLNEMIVTMRAIREGIAIIWVTVSPVLVAYLIYKQKSNRKALDANTAISQTAFTVANGHNEKIVEMRRDLNELVKPSLVQKVEVISDPVHPVHTKDEN